MLGIDYIKHLILQVE